MSENAHPVPDQMLSYLQGKLPPARVKELESHLAACPDCLARTRGLTWVAGVEEREHPGLARLLARAPATSAKASAAAIPPATPAKAPAATPPGTARMVAGHELLRELARGGLGVVYLARHPVLNAFRAIKRPQSRSDLERAILLARFRREVRAVGALQHDHIIRAHDAGSDDEGPYLVMEYLQGESLATLLDRHGPMGVPEACELVRQAALGLQTAHERGLVHRDIKPSNLVLARANSGARVVIIDWGLVKRLAGSGPADARDDSALDDNRALEPLTSSGMAMGTPDYMAPDQIADDSEVDARADIYSLGVTLYTLLAGNPPFHSRKNRAKLQGHLLEPFPPLVRAAAPIPRALAAILDKMVEKDPERRFKNAGDVARQLQPFGCGAESRSLLALLEPGDPAATPAPAGAGRFEAPTELGTPPPVAARNSWAPAKPVGGNSDFGPTPVKVRAPWQSRGTLMVATAGLLLLGGVALGIFATGGRKDDSKTPEGDMAKDPSTASKTSPGERPKGPTVLLDEDFRKPLAKQLALPEGWTGDAYGIVVDDEGRAYLEVNKKTGEHLVTLPRLPLGDKFFIEGEYLLASIDRSTATPPLSLLTMILEDETAATRVPIAIDQSGRVAIADNMPRLAPGTAKKAERVLRKPGPGAMDHLDHFRVIRDGRLIRVEINGAPTASATLEESGNFTTMQIGMSPGEIPTRLMIRTARLYKLKITTLSR